MNKLLTLSIFIFFLAPSCCKDKNGSNKEQTCLGNYQYIDGDCKCPPNTGPYGYYNCRPASENDFWVQSGDVCLQEFGIFIGDTSYGDIFSPEGSYVNLELVSQNCTQDGSYRYSRRSTPERGDHYYIHDLNMHSVIVSTMFLGCGIDEYEYVDFELFINKEWNEAELKYSFWNDIDTSRRIKKEFGKVISGIFRNNTGPKEVR